jgi:ABC-2 type transport system ATP-binding protein
METQWAVNLTQVSKVFGRRVHALRGVDLRVRRGDIFGLLGPNGAGKSTIVKIMMTVIRATSAGGTLLDRPVGHKPTLAKVGYLPEHHKFPDYLTGAQVLDFYGALCGVPRRDRIRRAGALLETVGMTRWAKTRVRGYSKGMRQRVGIAQALMNDPELVLLDEPTDGVDPVGRREIREMLTRLRDEGRTVFINSHLLSELEMVCDRVAIMVQGSVVSQGTIDELTSHRRYYEFTARAADSALSPSAPALVNGQNAELNAARGALYARALGAMLLPAVEGDPPGTLGWLEGGRLEGGNETGGGQATARRAWVDGGALRIAPADAPSVQPVLDALRRGGLIVEGVRDVRPSLEDLFMEAVTDPTTGAPRLPGAAAEPRR